MSLEQELNIEKIVSKYIKLYLKYIGVDYSNRQIKMEFDYARRMIDINVFTFMPEFGKFTRIISFKNFIDWVNLVERRKKINKLIKNG